jgi:hypothetical protein
MQASRLDDRQTEHSTTVLAVEHDEQRHLADVLRDYRERLESARKDLDPALDEHGIPTHPIAKRMLAVEARMLDVENALALDIQTAVAHESARGRWRTRPRQRLRELTAPRLGRLHHHPPEPLRVPTSYFAINPPDLLLTISIVTPSFGQGHFLERTLYSVINQNYPALEYIVQDGGSSDNTVEVLRRYQASLSHWASEPDTGQADALNRGFLRSTGEIMAYLNSDDLLLPGALSYVARYFSSHPDVDVLYGHRLMIDEHDRHIGSWVLPRHDDYQLTLLDFAPQETLFWRRSAWEAAGGQIDERLRFAIDWDLLLRFRESRAKIVRVPRFLGAFRVHDEQKTAKWDDLCLIECDLLRQRVHGRAMSHDEAFARAAPYLRRHVLHHIRHRIKARLPLPRQPVRTLPHEPWLRARSLEQQTDPPESDVATRRAN